MLRIEITPPEEVERSWAEWDRNRVRKALDETAPSVSMAEEAAALLDQREVVFRRRKYRLPPVPWPLAVRVNAHMDRLRTLGASPPSPDEELEVFAEACRLLRQAYRPANPILRALAPILPNPFRKATPRQVGRYLGFCYMSLRVDGAHMTTPPARPGTYSSRSAGLSTGSRGGSARTASRAPGVTS